MIIPKLCKDCKFHKKTFLNASSLCTRKDSSSPKYDLVTVKIEPRIDYADSQRIFHDECGKDAKYFEQKNVNELSLSVIINSLKQILK